VTALAGVSLTIARGEVVALVGHSGSGKSTLLRLVAGLERPSQGTIAIAGRNVSGRRFVPPEERGIGMMFQDYALFPHLRVIDNVAFGLNRLSRAEARHRAEAALDRIGLRHRADDYPHALSGGEQQRVALIRALVPAPGILLMDEPFSNLDRRTRDRIRDDTAAILRESKATAILVTHDPEDAMRVADRVMLMAAGRIARGGTTEELYREPGSLLVARFFADYNEIETTVEGGFARTPLGAFPASGTLNGADVVVCIRPHDLWIETESRDAPTGTVVGRAFVGDELVLLVWIVGMARALQIRAPVDTVVAVGDRIGIGLNPANVLVFPAG
jgi:iron(III) transport system ATP-binding protein